MPEQYSFATNRELKAPLEDVWNAIYNFLEWLQWWLAKNLEQHY